jgi:cytochrome c oxidase subunit 2
LHVPVGTAVRLTMTSEDVIHSFYVPAFRTKMDVLPGRYTTVWFQPTRTGEYHLFCAEYCGTEHSRMGGTVYVMEQVDYDRWLSGAGPGESMATLGERMFTQLRCDGCHRADSTGRGPSLDNVFGRTVALTGGQTVVADQAYLRESILNPRAKLVAGFDPVMPTFQGQVSEEQVMQLIAYIRSLGEAPQGRTGQ